MARLLLIGNSRWHWGEWHQGQLRRQWHEAPLGPGAEPPAEVPDLWAAVGPVPSTLAPWAGRRLGLAGVPLQACPPTLGVDRALAAWGAWRSTAAPVFVADAGTALSFTLVDKTGSFLGGRLMAGGLLQLRALHGATNALPALGGLEMNPTTLEDPWPTATAAAMAQAASIKVLSGAAAGKSVTLTKVVTTVGKPGVQVASITKRPNGYVLAHVEGAQRPSINGVALVTDTAPLSNGDLIELAGTQMQFVHA